MIVRRRRSVGRLTERVVRVGGGAVAVRTGREVGLFADVREVDRDVGRGDRVAPRERGLASGVGRKGRRTGEGAKRAADRA
jgi:hypothetical protein